MNTCDINKLIPVTDRELPNENEGGSYDEE